MPKRLYGTHDGCPRSVSYGSQQLDKIPPSPSSGGRICIKPTLPPRTSGDGTFLYSQPPPRSRETARWPYFYGLIHGTAVWPRVLKPYQIGSWDHYQGEFTMKPAFSHQTVFCGSLMLIKCGFLCNWFSIIAPIVLKAEKIGKEVDVCSVWFFPCIGWSSYFRELIFSLMMLL